MMSKGYHGRSSRGEWYQPPAGGGATVGQRRVDTLQQQIQDMETDMKAKAALQEKLERLQRIEADKHNLQEKVLERTSRSSSRNNSPSMLQAEMERLYGKGSPVAERNKTPNNDRTLIETIMQQRTKEFSQKQQEAALNAKYLDKERLKLQEARRRVEEQRRYLASTSPAGKIPFRFHNDKVYMPYEPYRELQYKNAMYGDSFVLPVETATFKKPEKVSFKVKFVPAEIGDNTWARYNNEITEGSAQENVDDALQTFLNFTSRHKRSQKPITGIRYVAQPMPEMGPYTRHSLPKRRPLVDSEHETDLAVFPARRRLYPKTRKTVGFDGKSVRDGYDKPKSLKDKEKHSSVHKKGNIYTVRHKQAFKPVSAVYDGQPGIFYPYNHSV